MTSIRVEFFGIPRIRVGAAAVSSHGNSLGEVLADLAERFPGFARDCLESVGPNEWTLNEMFVANLEGDRFIRDRATPLDDSAVLLIMSADAGG